MEKAREEGKRPFMDQFHVSFQSAVSFGYFTEMNNLKEGRELSPGIQSKQRGKVCLDGSDQRDKG